MRDYFRSVVRVDALSVPVSALLGAVREGRAGWVRWQKKDGTSRNPKNHILHELYHQHSRQCLSLC